MTMGFQFQLPSMTYGLLIKCINR